MSISQCLFWRQIAAPLTLPSTFANSICFNNLEGKPVILVFYPGDFTPVWGDQLTLYNELLPLFEGIEAQLLAISVNNFENYENLIRRTIFCHFDPFPFDVKIERQRQDLRKTQIYSANQR